MTSRRTFLLAGTAGGAALALAGWLRAASEPAAAVTATGPLQALDPRAPEIVAAVVPVMLAGALPQGDEARVAAVTATVANVGRTIAGLPPTAQRELGELFAMLAFAPARRWVAGVALPWNQATPADVAAFLDRWRDSRFLLLRSAYDALHQIVLAAWYGNPQSWPGIGYPGPPDIGR